MKNNILITGGCGFIGSHLTRFLVRKYSDYQIINLDKLTYAGNINNLKDISDANNYKFIKGDICNINEIRKVFEKYKINKVIHLAAESHVDRSIEDPFSFVKTNVLGTLNLLQISKEAWKEKEGNLFYHISTDEVYGSLGESGLFTENTRYDPHSPYSASKASSDHFVRAFSDTYGLPVVISNCSNNYGPYQFPEKLIPLFINNIIHRKPLPVYGSGTNIRDWLHVDDHVRAIDLIFHNGIKSATYNIGSNNEKRNIDLINLLVKKTDNLLGRPRGSSQELIQFVGDRAGHDHRYAIDSSKISEELGWAPITDFESGLEKTIQWYIDNQEWLEKIKSGRYLIDNNNIVS